MLLNQYIDHTLLAANTTYEEISKLCEEAVKYEFAAVCVNPIFVQYCKKELLNSNVKICTVIGFPLGTNKISTKIFEAKEAIVDAVDELDFVINLSLLKSGDLEEVEKEFEAFAQLKEEFPHIVVKCILEICYLTPDEIKLLCILAAKYKLDFIKTSTGFGTAGATEEDVKLMVENSSNVLQVKASGGIKTFEDADKYIKLGVTRIGTSNGVNIVKKISTHSDIY